MEPNTTLSGTPECIGPGRVLLVEPSGRLYLSRGYAIYHSDDAGLSWSRTTAMPVSWKRMSGRYLRLAARLLRFEVRSLAALPQDGLVAANREWVFHGQSGDAMMQPSQVEEGGQPAMTPNTITVAPDDLVVWGEYNPKTGHGNPVRIYASDDRGRHYHIVQTIPGGSVMHVHSIFFDSARDHYWVFTGDYDQEPGIGILSRDLRHFDWFVKGEQRYRLCEVFDFGKRFVYATDTPLEQNYVLSLDKDTGETERIMEVEGSCISACQFGAFRAFSTTVEPSSFSQSKHSSLWISRDGDHWTELLSAEKDSWHPIFFQFGSLTLPRGRSEDDAIFFSGQAVRGYDGRAFVVRPGDSSHGE